jgi:hypothetical protein
MSAAAKRRSLVTQGTVIEQARAAFTDLERWIMSPETLGLSLDEVEREQEKRGREAQRLLLQAHMNKRGPGDVGPAIEVVEYEGGKARSRRHGQRRRHSRRMLTVFGALAIVRTAYHAAEAASVHPLDEQAEFPERTFSYEVQRRLVIGSIQGPFDEAVERAEESTGLTISKRSAEQVLRDAARHFDSFYEGKNRVVPPPAKTGQILIAAADCKGIPMVKPEKALRVVRRGAGKKANKKRMATVATVFTQEPRVRTPEEVLESLFRKGPRLLSKEDEAPRWPGPEYKRVWASLERSKDDVVAEVVREALRRDPRGEKLAAVVTDGERALQQRLARSLPEAIQILDLMHALERLWKCAYCFHAQGTDEAEEWVKERTLAILRGKVSQVVKGIRFSARKRALSPAACAVVQVATAYLLRNKKRMRYDEYLRDGLPIASGSVEGACKNLVKDRMERSGMRWTIATAEAMLRLRAIYLSGDFDEYWRFYMCQERERLYPANSWKVAGK